MLPNPNNQIKNNVTKASAPAPRQVMGNPGDFCPNIMQSGPQFQMGMLNPQLAMPPFSNPSAFFAPTQLLPLPQGHLQNFNFSGLNPMFAHNAINSPQLLPNGQFNVPNLAQNMNRILQMQMQIANCGPGNLAGAPPSMINGNGSVQQLMNGNVSELIDGNHVRKDFGAPQQQRVRMFSPSAAESHVNDNVMKNFSAPQLQQNRQGNVGEFHGPNNYWKRSNNKKFIGNLNGNASQRGFMKQHFHHKQNSGGTIKFHNENRGKGYKNGAKTSFLSDSDKPSPFGKGRPFSLNYTEQEIRQWREQRKKNYPSKANIEKKLKGNSTQPEVTIEVAKIRRQQLKEILEKQAELGCEVAEIPSLYLSDSERQSDGRVKVQNAFGKRERFQNKFERRGKFRHCDRASVGHRPANKSANFLDQNNCIAKKHRLGSDSSVNNKREPSLLQKLLQSDVERDKKYLLQIFRFIVMNSFLEDWPSKSLKFPVVIVKESGDDSGSVEVVERDGSTSAGVIKSEERELGV